MNTTGFIRGYMAHNMEPYEFFTHVSDCLGNEFESPVFYASKDGQYVFIMDDYIVKISEEETLDCMKKDPYYLDRCILDSIRRQGFEFDYLRSQYIRYCYNLFYYKKDGTVY